MKEGEREREGEGERAGREKKREREIERDRGGGRGIGTLHKFRMLCLIVFLMHTKVTNILILREKTT